MIQLFKSAKNRNSIEIGNSISVIGPRSSGKTTYLAALCYWPMQPTSYRGRKRLFTVNVVGSDSEALMEKASSIILEGGSLEPTGEKVKEISNLQNFSLNIEIKRRISSALKINLTAKDYPGEIFEDLANGKSDSTSTEFIEECLREEVKGCLILFSDWEQKDSFYCRVITNLFNEIDNRNRMKNLRLAVVMSKCERGELWPGRHDPELDLFQTHLPRTHGILRQRLPRQNLSFFAVSTFGVLGKRDPRPNRMDEIGQDGRRAVLRVTRKWQPYGLITPLYWLDTGKHWGCKDD